MKLEGVKKVRARNSPEQIWLESYKTKMVVSFRKKNFCLAQTVFVTQNVLLLSLTSSPSLHQYGMLMIASESLFTEPIYNIIDGPFVSNGDDTCYFRFKDLKQKQNVKNKLPRRGYRVEQGSTSFRPDASYTSRLSVRITRSASLLFGTSSI